MELCGFCGGRGHPNWLCQKRGPGFWSPVHARKVEQYNLLHGSEQTPEQKEKMSRMRPRAPPGANFEAPGTPRTDNKTMRCPRAVHLELLVPSSQIDIEQNLPAFDVDVGDNEDVLLDTSNSDGSFAYDDMELYLQAVN